jgi:hypothetical protein
VFLDWRIAEVRIVLRQQHAILLRSSFEHCGIGCTLPELRIVDDANDVVSAVQ